MKFFFIYEVQIIDVLCEGDYWVFKEMVEQVLFVEQVGFDMIWCVEYMLLINYVYMSVLEIFFVYLVGCMMCIGFGYGVVCLLLVMNYLIKVVEWVVLFDILLGGCVYFGVGKGGSQQEVGVFGYDFDVLQLMIDELMYFVLKMFVQDEIEYDGQYIKILKCLIYLKLFQDLYLLMYFVCINIDVLLCVGQCGMGVLVFGFGGFDEVVKKNVVYCDVWVNCKLEDQVGFCLMQYFVVLCLMVVMVDGQVVCKIGICGQCYFMELFVYWYMGGEWLDLVKWGDDFVQVDIGEMVICLCFVLEEVVVNFVDLVFVMMNLNYVYGMVDDCIGYVGCLQVVGVDEVLFLCQMGMVLYEVQMEMICNIGEYVILFFNCEKEWVCV